MKTTALISILSATGALAFPGSRLFSRKTVNARASNIVLSNSVVNSAANVPFLNSDVAYDPDVDVALAEISVSTRQSEPDPNRNATTPDVLFTLFCTDAGFRGDCLVFGAPPGKCVSWSSFQGANETSVSDRFNDKVSSLATNTGGNCMFFWYEGCNNKGDDRGLTSSYNYDLSVALPEDERTVEYENNITSWRC